MPQVPDTLVVVKEPVFSRKYPIYLLQNGRIYIKLTSETDMVQLYGQEFANNRWEWYFSSHQVSAYTSIAMLGDPQHYKPISEAEFNEVRSRYLDFHRRLLTRVG